MEPNDRHSKNDSRAGNCDCSLTGSGSDTKTWQQQYNVLYKYSEHRRKRHPHDDLTIVARFILFWFESMCRLFRQSVWSSGYPMNSMQPRDINTYHISRLFSSPSSFVFLWIGQFSDFLRYFLSTVVKITVLTKMQNYNSFLFYFWSTHHKKKYIHSEFSFMYHCFTKFTFPLCEFSNWRVS